MGITNYCDVPGFDTSFVDAWYVRSGISSKQWNRIIKEYQHCGSELYLERCWGGSPQQATLVQFVDEHSQVQLLMRRKHKETPWVALVLHWERQPYQERFLRIRKFLSALLPKRIEEEDQDEQECYDATTRKESDP